MHGVERFERYLQESSERYKESDAGFIYSLAYVREFLFKVIAVSKAKSVCEIGSQGGLFSQELHRLYQEGVLQKLTIIDPFPSSLVTAMADESGCRVEKGLSLDVLQRLEPHDVYIVDGDHNYHTVTHELKAIFNHPEAIAIMHDIGWPCATRDMYYNPDNVPIEARHAFTFDVVLDPANDGIAVSGERSHGKYAVALNDGGPKNGVFPAMRDVVVELGLHVDCLPALLGVGVVRHAAHPATDAIKQLFPSDEIDAILWTLEENRIANWIAKQKAEDALRQSVIRHAQEMESALSGGVSGTQLLKLVCCWIKRRF